MLILLSVVLGVVIGLARGGRLVNLERLDLRYGWLIVAAVVVQLAAAQLAARDATVALSVIGGLFLVSNLVVLVVLWSNRAISGVLVLGLGLLLNLIATVPQGGF